jgi:predicted PurR-regulated permease PerM
VATPRKHTRAIAMSDLPSQSVPHDPTTAVTPGKAASLGQDFDLTRSVLTIVALAGLIGTSLWVLSPFIPALIWAVTIVVTTWPLMTRVETMLWGRRGLAVTVMTLALLLLFFVPLTLAIMTVLNNVDTIGGWIKLASNLKDNEPPSWLVSLPVVGPRAASFWMDLVEHGADPLLGKVMPYVGTFAGRVLREAGLIGSIGVQFLLSVLLCAVLYAYGEGGARAVLRFARRLAGDQGVRMTRLAAASVRGVALGVVVTAVVQSLLAGLGLTLVGVPAVALLTALMFLLALAQIGVIPVLLPAVIWLYWSGQVGWAIGLLIWTVVVSTMDNFMRPWLIKKGADLPFLLIFVGVVGGLIAFGLIGIFVGPVVLAVTYTLFNAWTAEQPAPAHEH